MAEQEADNTLQELFTARYREGSEWHSEFHKSARSDFEFVGLHQWNESLMAEAQMRKFPTLTLDMTGNVINAVSSSEIVNRFEPKYLPRSPEDQALSDKTTAGSRYIRQQGGAEFVDSGAFRDMAICGVGCAEWYHDESLGRSGRVQTKRIPIEEVIWDPAAREMNAEDARWIIRGRWIGEDEFRALYPDEPLPPAVPSSPGGGAPNMYMWGRSSRHVYTPDRYQGADARRGFYVASKSAVLVFEMQDWFTEAEYTVEMPEESFDPMTGQLVVTMSEVRLNQEEYNEFRKIRADTRADGIPAARKRMKRVYRRAVFAGDKLVASEETVHDGFTYLLLTGFEDMTNEGMRWFGLVRKIRDAQKVANRGFSQILHTLAVNPKGVVVYEEGAFDNPEEAERKWATTGSFIKARQGMLTNGSIEIVKGEYPVDAERVALLFLGLVNRVVGIDPTFMGSVGGSGGDLRRVSGTAMSQVIQQGQMMLAILFDSLRKFRINQGRLLLSFMRSYIPAGEMMRIVGDASTQSPEFISFMEGELDDVDFDVIVGEVPTSPNQQEEAWRTLTESGALKSLLDHGWLDGEGVAMLAYGWPEELRSMVRENAREQKQMMQMQMQAQMAGGGGVPPQEAPPAPVQ